MRSLRTEYGHILGTFTRFALAFPEKTLSLSFDGRAVYNFQPSSLQERITACFGREAAAGLEELENSGMSGRAWEQFSPARKSGADAIIYLSIAVQSATRRSTVPSEMPFLAKAAWSFSSSSCIPPKLM